MVIMHCLTFIDNCNYVDWMVLAAQVTGLNSSLYDHIVFVPLHMEKCGGVLGVGAFPGRWTVNTFQYIVLYEGAFAPMVFLHELG